MSGPARTFYFASGSNGLAVSPDDGDHGHATYVEPLVPGLLVDGAVAVVHEDGGQLVLRAEWLSTVRHLDRVEESQVHQHHGNTERRQLPCPGRTGWTAGSDCRGIWPRTCVSQR